MDQHVGRPEMTQVLTNISEVSVGNGETQHAHQWNEADRNIIQEYKQYHWDMYYFFTIFKEMDPAR